MKKALALALLVAGCKHQPAPAPPPPQTAAPPAPSASTAAPPACQSATPTKLANGACSTNADCVLTDLPAECDACNLERAYPTLRSSLEARRCDAGCVPSACPPHDKDTGAFYRAECRHGRCIAWRYHSGG